MYMMAQATVLNVSVLWIALIDNILFGKLFQSASHCVGTG